MINVDVSVKNVTYVKKIMFGIICLDTCSFENEKYLASVMDNSSIICDEVIGSYDKDADEEDQSSDEDKS